MKFKDNDGNVYKIETRGEKTVDGIYFLAKDVSKEFDMPNLYTTIISKNHGRYETKTHYNYFLDEKQQNVRK